MHIKGSQGSGPDAGTLVADMGTSGNPGLVMHRASLLRELLAPLPQEILHTSKKLVGIVQTESKVEIQFEDGAKHEFDVVIGADGIFGSVRQHVLGDAAAKACAASAAGFWDSRNVVPYEVAKAKLGAEYFETDRQFGWIGKGAFLIHDVLEDRKMVQCVISVGETNPSPERKRPLSKAMLEDTLGGWLDGPIAKGMIDVSCSSQNYL